MSPSIEARITEHAVAPTPPLPVASPPLPLPSPLTTSPTDAGAPLGYRAAGPRKRAAFATFRLSGLEIGESSAAGAARLSRYGYIKNHMKTVKNKQARTRERKSEQKPEAKPGKSSLSQIQSNYGQ
ncbi:hypothetical protein Tco_0816019 [Tanacetum coccineum]